LILKKAPSKLTFKKLLQKGETSLIDFWQKTRQEARETKEAEGILVKYVEGKKISAEEKIILKNQTFDIVKVIFIGIPLAVIPGFSIVMIFIVKIGRRYKVNVLPSAFNGKEDGKNKAP
jgi:hypothetical protein